MYDYIDGDFVHGPDVYLDDYYMDEKWWYIDGIPNYMISDHGRVWSEKSKMFLKPKKMDRAGHLGVCLRVNGRPHYVYIHRLMAKAFIPNTNRDPIVRHLNDIKEDNSLENLAWGTQRDNQRDSVRNGTAYILTDYDREKGFRKVRRPILAINLETDEEYEFRGQQEASRILKIQQSNIWKVLNGERRQAGGFYFEYLDEDGGEYGRYN